MLQIALRGSEVRPLVAWIAGVSIAWGALGYVVLTIAVLTDGYGYALTEAGTLSTVELLAMAVATFVMGRSRRLISLWRLAVNGALLSAVANFLTAFAHQTAMVGILRAFAGFGAGAVVAAVNTSMARTADPGRAFAIANAGNLIISAAFFAAMPVIYTHLSYRAYFIAFALFFAIAAAALAWLPGAGLSSVSTGQLRFRLSPWQLTAVLAAFLLWLCSATLWSISERVAAGLGMSEESIGYLFSISTFAGVLGTLIAWWYGERGGRTAPLILSTAATGACFAILTLTHSVSVFWWAMCCYGVTIYACLPYLMAFTASIDGTGATARLVGGAVPLATALAPVLATRIASLFSYSAVGYITATGMVVVCLLIATVNART
jgi:MFS family permease